VIDCWRAHSQLSTAAPGYVTAFRRRSPQRNVRANKWGYDRPRVRKMRIVLTTLASLIFGVAVAVATLLIGLRFAPLRCPGPHIGAACVLDPRGPIALACLIGLIATGLVLLALRPRGTVQ
jgi:hypothetical protein